MSSWLKVIDDQALCERQLDVCAFAQWDELIIEDYEIDEVCSYFLLKKIQDLLIFKNQGLLVTSDHW